MGLSVRRNNNVSEQQITVNTPLSASSTGTGGAFAFINPLNRGVMANVTYRITTIGTGTIDFGVGSDGTGSGTDIIATGTLALGTKTAGDYPYANNHYTFIAGNGTTGDSIVAKISDAETTTGTMAGTVSVVYYPV